jgi:hypothetical protein
MTAAGMAANKSADAAARWAAPLGAGLALVGIGVLTWAFTVWIGRSPGWAYDFHAYYDAALRYAATGSPYQAETLAGPFRPGPYGLYLYSPPLAILFVPLTWLGENVAMIAWLGLRVGILALTCALMPVSGAIRLAALGVAALSAPFLFDLNLGNISLIVTFFAVLMWRWHDRPIAGVALAAALTLRPTMAIVAGWWLIRGRWRPVAAAAIAGFGIFAVTLPFVGLERWFEYLTVLRNVSNVTGVRSNVDLGSSVLLLGGPMWIAQIALYAGYLLAAGAVMFSLRKDRELSFVVTVTSTLLLAPLLWDHYLTLLIIPAAFVASRGRPWAIVLPLLCWLPLFFAFFIHDLRGIAEFMLPYSAVIGVLLPFLAKPRGEAAGTFLDNVREWRTKRSASQA